MKAMVSNALSNQKGKKVEWIELFYDLAFVATTASFASQADLQTGFGIFTSFMSLAVMWWAWSGFVFYCSRFSNTSVLISWLTVVKIIGVCGLGVSAQVQPEIALYLFPASYILVRVMLLVLYVIAYRDNIADRTLIKSYLTGFSVALIPWVAMLWYPNSWLWLAPLAIAIDLGTPLVLPMYYHKNSPPDLGHVTERLALFYLIVLGEVFISIANTGSTTKWDPVILYISACSISFVFMLWWMYSEEQNITALRGISRKTQLFFYMHFPLTVCTFFFSVSIKYILHHPTDMVTPIIETLLFVSLASVLAAITFIRWLRHEHMSNHIFRFFVIITLAVLGVFHVLSSAPVIITIILVLLVLILLVEKNNCHCGSKISLDF